MERYEKRAKIAEGTSGIVSEVIEKATMKKYAMKKFKGQNITGNDGLAIDLLREIKLLRELEHENIINMVDVFVYHTSVCFVMELMPYDLGSIIKLRGEMPMAVIKSYLYQILKGVSYLHSHFVMHRDLKPQNLLIGKDGNLKITDFNLAKRYGSSPILSPNVATRYYRAPELFFEAKYYGPSVDIWSVGCIFAEMITKGPFFNGTSDFDQLAHIFQIRGTPDPFKWPGVTELPRFFEFDRALPPIDLEEYLPELSPAGIDLLDKMIRLNPNERITAEMALRHSFFEEKPELLEAAEISRILAIDSLQES